MALYKSDVAADLVGLANPIDGSVRQAPVSIKLPTAALVVGDLLELADLMPSVQLLDYDFVAPQLDSNGTPTLAFSLGILNAGKTDLATVYETGLTFGRTASGSIARAGNAAAASADSGPVRKLALKVTTAAATAATAGKTITSVLHLRS